MTSKGERCRCGSGKCRGGKCTSQFNI